MACPLCASTVSTVDASGNGSTIVDCPNCTTYQMDTDFENDVLPSIDARMKRNLSEGLRFIDPLPGQIHRITADDWKMFLLDE